MAGPPTSVRRVASPRSRKSHVRSSVRSAHLQLGELGLMVAEVHRSGSSTRRAGRAVGRHRLRPRPRLPRDRPARCSMQRSAAVARRRDRRRRARRAGPASGRASRSRPPCSARARSAACSRCSRPPPSPPRGVRRSGCPEHRSRRVLAPWEFEYRGRSWADDLERADVLRAGRRRRPSGRRPRSSSRKQSAPSTPASKSYGQCVLSASISTTSLAPKRGSFARSRTSRGGSSGSARAGDPLHLRHPDREVADDRAGAGVERMADLGHPGGQRLVAFRRPRATRPPNVGRSATEKSTDPKIPSSGPSQATGRVQPSRAAEAGDQGVEREQRRQDQQHVERTGRVEEGPPRRGDREDEARDEERAEADDDDRPDGRAADRPRQPDQADDRDRQADQEQDAEQVVAEALDPHLDQPRRSDRQVARQRRWVVPGEDVEAGDRQGVGQRPGPGTGCRTPTQSRIAHGRKTRPATTATTRDEPDAGRAVELADAPGDDRPRRGR